MGDSGSGVRTALARPYPSAGHVAQQPAPELTFAILSSFSCSVQRTLVRGIVKTCGSVSPLITRPLPGSPLASTITLPKCAPARRGRRGVGRSLLASVLGVADVGQHPPRRGLRRLRNALRTWRPCAPSTAGPRVGEYVVQRTPETERPVPHGGRRGSHAPTLEVTQHVGPGDPVAIGDGDRLLVPSALTPTMTRVRSRSSSKRTLKWDSVGPHVDEVAIGEVSLGEGPASACHWVVRRLITEALSPAAEPKNRPGRQRSRSL